MVAGIGDERIVKCLCREVPESIELQPESHNPERGTYRLTASTADFDEIGAAVSAVVATRRDSAEWGKGRDLGPLASSRRGQLFASDSSLEVVVHPRCLVLRPFDRRFVSSFPLHPGHGFRPTLFEERGIDPGQVHLFEKGQRESAVRAAIESGDLDPAVVARVESSREELKCILAWEKARIAERVASERAGEWLLDWPNAADSFPPRLRCATVGDGRLVPNDPALPVKPGSVVDEVVGGHDAREAAAKAAP